MISSDAVRRRLAGALVLIAAGAAFLAAVPRPAHAQELVIVDAKPVEIGNPEHSRAFYDKLAGEPALYKVRSDEPFTLFLTLLTPRVDGAPTDFSASVVDVKNPEVPLASLNGAVIEWQDFTERSGGDSYLAGPMFRATVPGGEYEITVSRPGNVGPYVLIVGEERGFSLTRILNAYASLPVIKSEFFGKPAMSAFLTPLLLVPIVVLGAIILVILFVLYRRRSLRE